MLFHLLGMFFAELISIYPQGSAKICFFKEKYPLFTLPHLLLRHLPPLFISIIIAFISIVTSIIYYLSLELQPPQRQVLCPFCSSLYYSALG